MGTAQLLPTSSLLTWRWQWHQWLSLRHLANGSYVIWLHWQLIVHRSNTVLVYELVGDDNSAALVTALTLQFNKPHWCKTKVSTLKAYRGQVIYWKAGKLHIVGLALDWTFHWWWLASILNALVPQVNIFRVLTFLVDESMPRRGLKAWFHLLRARTVIASRTA